MDYATSKAARLADELRGRGLVVTQHCALSNGAKIGIAFRFPSGKERGILAGTADATADAFVAAYDREASEHV